MKYETFDWLKLKDILWPDVYFYDKQKEIIESVQNNDETIVPAGNMLGKDFVAGFIALAMFLTRTPCRIVTTSAKDDHLRVLWGEINRYIETSKYPLKVEQGGPLLVNHQDIRRVINGNKCPLSYIIAMVAAPGSIAAMQGHHIARTSDGIKRTLFISDESSSVPDDYYKMASTWANSILIIGNTWECTNFFRRGVDAGDLPTPDGKRYYRKIIRITAEDSPNVRFALAQKAHGIEPTDEIIVPGVKSWGEYQKNRLVWDPIQQTVCLDARFYEGAELRLFPRDWLNRAIRIAKGRSPVGRGESLALGIDTAEGGDKSAWAVVGETGLIHLLSMKTPDTSVIPATTIGLMNEYGIPAENVMFDAGGGGKEHADLLRSKGFKVRLVAFGDPPVTVNKFKRMRLVAERKEEYEERQIYKNRRAEMYGMLRQKLKPENGHEFGIPGEYKELIDQLTPIPLQYDGEGKMVLPPKHKKDPTSKIVTLAELIGHSPDEADALVIANFCLSVKPTATMAGGF